MSQRQCPYCGVYTSEWACGCAGEKASWTSSNNKSEIEKLKKENKSLKNEIKKLKKDKQ
jgi:hypothetical protein